MKFGLSGFEFFFIKFEGGCVFRITGQVVCFVGIVVNFKEFEFRAVNIFADGFLSVGGTHRLLVLRLETTRSPEVGGKWVREGMGDIPD